MSNPFAQTKATANPRLGLTLAVKAALARNDMLAETVLSRLTGEKTVGRPTFDQYRAVMGLLEWDEAENGGQLEAYATANKMDMGDIFDVLWSIAGRIPGAKRIGGVLVLRLTNEVAPATAAE